MEIDDALAELSGKEKSTHCARLLHICERFFGKPRIQGSHHIFKMPWPGDPRINIQADKTKAKAYQVRDVIRCLTKLKDWG